MEKYLFIKQSIQFSYSLLPQLLPDPPYLYAHTISSSVLLFAFFFEKYLFLK